MVKMEQNATSPVKRSSSSPEGSSSKKSKVADDNLTKSQSDSTANSSKKSKSAEECDFSAIIRRSHSLDDDLIGMMTSNPTPKPKVINDSIHGHIECPSVALAIIDTPQFQRLRFLKQVGTLHFVYPTATHTRFQHSLGVGHLARKFCSELRKQNPDLVDEKDVICVMLAGLCHDLGHGPFSHMWEYFVNEAGQEWHHEDSSVAMLDYLIEDNNLKPILKKEADLDETDILFIKELIAGPLEPITGRPTRIKYDLNSGPWPYRGRPESKSFLYEIVANKISGIDVDKWDYFLRDDYYLKIGHIFGYERFISFSKVMEVGENKRRRICMRDKEAELLLEMFMDRARLHRHGYQHRVSRVIDRMMVDAFLIADKHISVFDSNKKSYSLSESCREITAHAKLSDEQIFFKIRDSENPEVAEAQILLQRILKRNFYQSVAEINVKKESRLRGKSERDLLVEIQKYIGKKPVDFSQDPLTLFQEPLLKDEIVVIRRLIDMGMGDSNPVRKVTFYNKDNKLNSIKPGDIALHMNEHMNVDLTFWVCCKRPEIRALKETLQAVKDWAEGENVTDINFDD